MKRGAFFWIGGSLVGVGSLAWWQRNEIARAAITRRTNEHLALSKAPPANDTRCLLTPEQVEGPFFLRAPLRSDIREDRAGLPLDLSIQVVRGDSCAPVANATVEVWHCDAAGRYSGYPEHLSRKPLDTLLYLDGPNSHVEPTNTKTYLRGAQTSDQHGLVGFTTIVPGWYEPRVTHIHVKVFVNDTSYVTTQLYFPGDQINELYANHPDYAPHGKMPYHHGNDMVLGTHPDANGLLLAPRPQAGGLSASCRLGIG